jgi:hypothetical protein
MTWILEIVTFSLNSFARLPRPSFLITLKFVGEMGREPHVFRILTNAVQVLLTSGGPAVTLLP